MMSSSRSSTLMSKQCAPARTTATCDGRSHGSAVWLGVRQQGRWARCSLSQRSLFLVGSAEDPVELGSDDDASRVLRGEPSTPLNTRPRLVLPHPDGCWK